MNRVEHVLTPICNYLILPLFAFSNTGLDLGISMDFTQSSTLMMVIICGLVIGKPLGIMLFSYIGTKLHIVEMQKGTDWMSILNVPTIAGIGFTMSIFIIAIHRISSRVIYIKEKLLHKKLYTKYKNRKVEG